MRVLTVTNIFPSRVTPAHGVFVLQRVQAVRRTGAEVRVVAPVPWVPPGPVPARYARTRSIPRTEEVGGIDVRHPRYLMVPKVGMYLQDRSYALGVARALREEVERFAPDVIDVHYLYPDACAVARVADELGVPFVCSARGSDVKLLGKIPVIAKRIREALGKAAGVVAVSSDLAETIRSLGLFEGDIRVIPNGVDPERFRPRDRDAARAELGLDAMRRNLVCVGHLAEVHGQRLLIEALAHDDAPVDVDLHLVGGGADLAALRQRADELDVAGRVHFHGPVPHDQVPLWFAAADASLHPGQWAGCPNAVLESLACGTPCLASDLPEMREVIEPGRDGLLVKREVGAIARGLAQVAVGGTSWNPRPPRTWDEVGAQVRDWLEHSLGREPTTVR